MKAFLTIILTIGFIKQVSAQCDPPCLSDEVCQPYYYTFDETASPPVTTSEFQCVCNQTIYDNPDLVDLLIHQPVSCSPERVSITITVCLGIKISELGCFIPFDVGPLNPCLILKPLMTGTGIYSFDLTSSDPKCAVEYSKNPTDVTTNVTIFFDCEPVKGILYYNDINITYTCSYPLQYNITLDGSLKPYISTVFVSVAGAGSFATTVQLFKDASYNIPYTTDELSNPILVATRIYVKASVNADPNVYSVRVDTVSLTPSPDPNDANKYFVILQGCRAPGTSAIMSTNGNKISSHFSFSMIQFTISKFVYVNLAMTMCNGTCTVDCTGKRGRDDNPVATSEHKIGPIISIGESSGSGTYLSLPCTWKMWTLLTLLMIKVM